MAFESLSSLVRLIGWKKEQWNLISSLIQLPLTLKGMDSAPPCIVGGFLFLQIL